MKEILNKLGFHHMIGPLWQHRSIGIISVNENDDIEKIAKSIYEKGYSECQLQLRTLLGIKPSR